jgi:dTDP-4-dehydrorhamnose reductase
VRILVTGAGGGLGRSFVGLAPGEHEIVAFTHAQLDVGDAASVASAIDDARPAVVVNCAAYTSVDGCERDPARAMRDNAEGPRALAVAAEEHGATLVHVSTDYVFDGEKGSPYDETDATNPINGYGRSKLAGEVAVRGATPRHVILRTSYVFGGGSDYVTTMLRRLADGEPAGAVADRTGSPTYARHLAERLLPLALAERFGTYHLGGPEAITRYTLLLRAKALAGGRLSGEVLEQHADELGLPAARPRDSSLTSERLPALVERMPPMPPLDDALRDLLGAL